MDTLRQVWNRTTVHSGVGYGRGSHLEEEDLNGDQKFSFHHPECKTITWAVLNCACGTFKYRTNCRIGFFYWVGWAVFKNPSQASKSPKLLIIVLVYLIWIMLPNIYFAFIWHHFRHPAIVNFYSSRKPFWDMISLVLKMGKLRYKECKKFCSDHIVRKWQRENLSARSGC